MHPAYALIGQIARIDPAALQPDWPLSRLGLHSSLGLAVVRSALERTFQRRFTALTWQTTLGEIAVAVDAGTGGSPPAAPAPAGPAAVLPAGVGPSGPFGGRRRTPPPAAASPADLAPPSAPPLPARPLPLGHGVDLEEQSAFPVWASGAAAEAFYRDHFTAAERALAAAHPDPRAHLCGLWCAKEAVRKSDPALLGLTAAEIGIEADAGGAPRVRLLRPGWEGRFAIALSISHSAAYAVASAITQRLT